MNILTFIPDWSLSAKSGAFLNGFQAFALHGKKVAGQNICNFSFHKCLY
jgi:hypothetical protein